MDFEDGKYDFRTEVYFVGMLFEKIIREGRIEHFHYGDLLRRMCFRDADRRISTFSEVLRGVRSDQFSGIQFGASELKCYRRFADALRRHVTRIAKGVKYVEDLQKIERDLGDAYRSFMLEEFVPDAARVTQCFVAGTYYYKRDGLPVALVKEYLDLMRACSEEKNRIILANLHAKLDTVTRYDPFLDEGDDDIPF